MKKGFFITFEGIDRSGKSTQSKKLVARLEKDGYPVKSMRDPGGTLVSEQVREILLNVKNSIAPVTELLLYEAARAQIVAEKIKPALEAGEIVVIDRFYDSTTAYQGYGRGLDLTLVQKANELAAQGLCPDLTLFIDLSWETAELRSTHRSKDRLESEAHDFFERVRNGYHQIGESAPDRFVTLDGSLPLEVITDEIYKVVCRKLQAR